MSIVNTDLDAPTRLKICQELRRKYLIQYHGSKLQHATLPPGDSAGVAACKHAAIMLGALEKLDKEIEAIKGEINSESRNSKAA